MLFGREFQMRGPTDRKPREPSVVLRRGSIRRSAEEDQSGPVGVYAQRRDDMEVGEVPCKER